MELFGTIVIFAAGVAVDAIYNNLRKHGESQAYREGYLQAEKEWKIRSEETWPKVLRAEPRYVGKHQVEDTTETNEKNIKVSVPESFMQDLKGNGRAAMRLK